MLRLGFRYGEIRAMYEKNLTAWLVANNETTEDGKTYIMRREKKHK